MVLYRHIVLYKWSRKEDILQKDHKEVLQDSYFLYCDTEDVRLVFIEVSISISLYHV